VNNHAANNADFPLQLLNVALLNLFSAKSDRRRVTVNDGCTKLAFAFERKNFPWRRQSACPVMKLAKCLVICCRSRVKAHLSYKRAGCGFGLAVVKRLIEAQNGEVTYKTQNGKGTTFTIQLPLK